MNAQKCIVIKFDMNQHAKVIRQSVDKQGRPCVRVQFYDEAGSYRSTRDFFASDVVPIHSAAPVLFGMPA